MDSVQTLANLWFAQKNPSFEGLRTQAQEDCQEGEGEGGGRRRAKGRGGRKGGLWVGGGGAIFWPVSGGRETVGPEIRK